MQADSMESIIARAHARQAERAAQQGQALEGTQQPQGGPSAALQGAQPVQGTTGPAEVAAGALTGEQRKALRRGARALRGLIATVHASAKEEARAAEKANQGMKGINAPELARAAQLSNTLAQQINTARGLLLGTLTQMADGLEAAAKEPSIIVPGQEHRDGPTGLILPGGARGQR